jgi:hypothetical protein
MPGEDTGGRKAARLRCGEAEGEQVPDRHAEPRPWRNYSTRIMNRKLKGTSKNSDLRGFVRV